MFKWQIYYNSQWMSENPNININALCNSYAKITCRSSQSISAFLYAGSSIQNASEQIVSCIHFTFVNFIIHVVFFLLGDSLASKFYVPTFRNTLSVPSS
jgi:hypothetical protein